MKRLFLLLKKYNHLLLFLFLEIIAVYLLVQNNHFQQTVFLNTANRVTGNLYETKNQVVEYFRLKKINNELANENARLKSQAFSSFQPLFGENIVINDTVYYQQYTYLSAKTINNSVNKRENYITLNKGSLNGIEPGMGVISTQGVVGIVKNVSNHYATVISILHPKTSISAKFKKNKYHEKNNHIFVNIFYLHNCNFSAKRTAFFKPRLFNTKFLQHAKWRDTKC